jgi:hypothetical protein
MSVLRPFNDYLRGLMGTATQMIMMDRSVGLWLWRIIFKVVAFGPSGISGVERKSFHVDFVADAPF